MSQDTLQGGAHINTHSFVTVSSPRLPRHVRLTRELGRRYKRRPIEYNGGTMLLPASCLEYPIRVEIRWNKGGVIVANGAMINKLGRSLRFYRVSEVEHLFTDGATCSKEIMQFMNPT